MTWAGYDTCRPGRGEWYFPLIVTVLFGYLSEPLCPKWVADWLIQTRDPFHSRTEYQLLRLMNSSGMVNRIFYPGLKVK